ncbi:uncharacterized protein LOC142324493 [Lycorma delicatula]|uniref:uncharacterized protein LOC142324493 n=1 Tax=Lycorma delicatula TaxID=130591 RepID=UPI003F50D867
MKFNPDGFITTNFVLLSIVFFTIASAYPSILPKFKEERKARSTGEEEGKGLGFRPRMHDFGLDHTDFWLGKSRYKYSDLGANGRIMPVFRSNIARYDTIIPSNDPKVSEARVTNMMAKIPRYASPMPTVSGFRPRIKGLEPKLAIFSPKFRNFKSKIIDFGNVVKSLGQQIFPYLLELLQDPNSVFPNIKDFFFGIFVL